MTRARTALDKRQRQADVIIKSAERRLEKIFFDYDVKVKLHRTRRTVIVSCEEVATVVCNTLGVSLSDIKGKARGKQAIADARQIAMAITLKVTKYTLRAIGNYYSGRDHSTVTHARENTKDLCGTDPQFRLKYEQCEKAWNAYYRKQLRNAKLRKTQTGDRTAPAKAAKRGAIATLNAG